MNYLDEFAPGELRRARGTTQYEYDFDAEWGALWAWMQPQGNPCFSLSFLNDIEAVDQSIVTSGGKVLDQDLHAPVNYYVYASRSEGVFNYGGDLALFLLLIKARERDALAHYAKRCLDCLYPKIRNFGSSTLTTISLVQGDALGGGFEAALSSDVIIAEERATMGFPEILFNLFPGMGGYSLVARRAGMGVAEDLISSGRMLSARELKEIGLVDVVAPNGEGENVVQDWINRHHKRRNGLQSMYKTRQEVFPIERKELDAISEVWVDAAMRLGERDLKMMRRIVSAQLKRMEGKGESLPTVQDLDRELIMERG